TCSPTTTASWPSSPCATTTTSGARSPSTRSPTGRSRRSGSSRAARELERREAELGLAPQRGGAGALGLAECGDQLALVGEVRLGDRVDQLVARVGERDHDAPAVGGVRRARDQP